MIDPIGNPYRQVEKIKRKIDTIENMKQKIRNRVNREIKQSTPDFAEVLSQKQAQKSQGIDGVVRKTARKHGLDSELVRSVIEVESGFDQQAVSEDGARGYMQLMPETAKELNVNPNDPQENIKGGTEYLARQIDEFGNLKEALAAYNAGPGAVKKHGGIPPFPETQNYVKQVMETYRNYKKKQ